MQDFVLSRLGTGLNIIVLMGEEGGGVGVGVGGGWSLIFWEGRGVMPKKESPDSRIPEDGISVIRARK